MSILSPARNEKLSGGTLHVDLGVMMLVGFAVSLPAVAASLVFASWADRRMPVTPEFAEAPVDGEQTPAAGTLPSLFWSLAPIVVPVLLITTGSIVNALAVVPELSVPIPAWRHVILVLGNPNITLLLSAVIALLTYWRQRRPHAGQLSDNIGDALMAAGVIVLITCAGGAFGAALKMANVALSIEALAGDVATHGYGLLFLAFFVASLIKFAQGSSTAAMIVTSAMLAAMLDNASLGFHPVYVATAIGSGSLVGSWMNDSGFWIFARMGGLSELETLKTWTPLLALLGVVSMLMTLLLAAVLPMMPTIN